jgi:protein-L-isoaspartate(D-aspartate) O-methyltransferase
VEPRPLSGRPITGEGTQDFAIARRRMIEEQLVQRGIRDPRVLQAMFEVPRHLFVDQSFWGRAYGDHALPTVEGQTISQPYIVARMLELAELEPEHRVLEIGTGSGYQTALLARLAGTVFSVERNVSLSRAARARLDTLGLAQVTIRNGDGSLGWPEFAPYARVLVTAAAPRVPQALLDQLDRRGVLVIPVGGPRLQWLEVWRREGGQKWSHTRQGECRFVPLVGRDAWQEAPDTREEE